MYAFEWAETVEVVSEGAIYFNEDMWCHLQLFSKLSLVGLLKDKSRNFSLERIASTVSESDIERI